MKSFVGCLMGSRFGLFVEITTCRGGRGFMNGWLLIVILPYASRAREVGAAGNHRGDYRYR